MAELLIPVSTVKEIKAAVMAGADALVFEGTTMFGQNLDNLKSAILYCRKNEVRCYFELKHPQHDREVADFVKSVATLASAGADALILSSLGSAVIARQVCPEIPLFAGDALSVTSLDGMEELRKLGFRRATAAKELNKYQIEHLKKYGSLALMVYVQREMCMGYDGMCYAAMKNGGKCEGFCREVYSFSGTGRRRSEFPLSLKDMCLAAFVRELLLEGVDALAVGRSVFKGEKDVANITAAYARMIAEERFPSSGELRVLTRSMAHGGYSDGFYQGRIGPDMQGRPESKELARLPIYDSVAAMEDLPTRFNRRRNVTFYFMAQSNQKIMLAAVDSLGNKTLATGSMSMGGYLGPRLSDSVKVTLSNAGDDRYRVDGAKVHIAQGVGFDPNEVEILKQQCIRNLRGMQKSPSEYTIGRYTAPVHMDGYDRKPQLVLSYRRLEQIGEEALRAAPKFIYLPVDEMVDGLELAESLLGCGIRLACVLPAVITDNEVEDLTEKLNRLRAIGVEDAVVGNLAGLELARSAGFAIRGDLFLNVRTTSDLEALKDLGLESASAMFDMNLKDIGAMSKLMDLEVLAYGRVPLMVTENCISKNHYGLCDKCESPRSIVGRDGEIYPIVGEAGCRNVLLDSQKLYLADRMSDLASLGVRYLRLSFTTENRMECAEILKQYTNTQKKAPVQKPWRGAYYGG
ncbi:MAG: U32 family peptidase [Clostridia bacterium]|nr:U32 family peptidase [Oscillospiraceae bacterium]MBQ4624433.1 U32 family peptidase [Clostridia bacterium]MBQ6989957.1 U32 family peptidase [Clostridia bacterium]MBR6762597.1 U32 family peptidase [Clostridia bacterium]